MMKKVILVVSVVAIVLLTTVCVFSIAGSPIIPIVDIPEKVDIEENVVFEKMSLDMKKGINVQDNVEYYTYFISVLEPTKEERSYIDKLINDGYDTVALIKIFDFWRYTNEDIDIIEKAYSYKPYDVSISYWVDDAFIALSEKGETKYDFVGLTVDEVKSYIESGISPDDIKAADKISRKGIKNINEILQQRLDNASWCEIANEIYALNLTEEEIEQLKSIEDPFEIIESEKLAKRTKADMKETLKASANGESSARKNYEFKTTQMEGSKKALIKQKLWDDSKKTEKEKAPFREGDLF